MKSAWLAVACALALAWTPAAAKQREAAMAYQKVGVTTATTGVAAAPGAAILTNATEDDWLVTSIRGAFVASATVGNRGLQVRASGGPGGVAPFIFHVFTWPGLMAAGSNIDLNTGSEGQPAQTQAFTGYSAIDIPFTPFVLPPGGTLQFVDPNNVDAAGDRVTLMAEFEIWRSTGN